MEQWKEYRLGEVVNILDNKRVPLSSKERSNRKGSFPYYGAQGIIDYIDDYIFDGTYLLVAEDGENLKSHKQQISQIAKGKYWVNNHAHILESNGKCDIRYICYLLNTIDISGYVTGSAQPKLNQENLKAITLKLPSLATQIRIADFISMFDDKIALNRKINSNLEEQAKALFKSWFIDFEPFKGGKFIDSELGMIPEGWNVKSASDIFNITIGKTPPRKESKWFTKGIGNVWVSISDMKLNGAFIGHSSEKLSDDAIAKFNIVMVPKDTILLSFKLTIGRVAISSCDLTTNEAIARFSIDNPRLREFTYLFLKNYNYQSLGSTSSIATAVNSKIIKSMPFLLPDADTTESFHKLSKPLFDQIEVTQKQTDCLAFIRDTLLPKLMSGEIDVEHSKLLFI